MNMDTHMDMSGHAGHAEHAAQVDALFDTADATHVAVKDGNWSDASTWSNGKVPGDGALVHIPAGKEVTYDVYSEKELDMVRVDGNLSWSRDKDTSMHVDTIVSSHGSKIEIGSMGEPMPADVSAEITFVDGPIDIKADPDLISRGMVTFGEVDIHGAAKESYLKIAGGADAGSKTITVEGDTANWEVGDQILLVGTEFMGTDGNGVLQTQDEARVIVSINGNKITFDQPLKYDHEPPAGHDFDTFVGNLSRNVVLQSENPEGTRGHFMMHNGMGDADGVSNSVSYAEFRELGRTDHSTNVGTSTNPEGRYSIHLHEIGTDPDDAGAIIEGNAVIGSPGWGIVQHSSKASINENIVFDVTGSGIVSEMGDETGEWNGNLVSSVTGSNMGGQTGSEGAAYENQSRVIVQQDNIAANSKIAWNYSGRESFPEDDAHNGAPKDGIHRQMFEREQLPFDPSPFDVALDHEEPPITDFNDNTAIASGTGLRVFHRQFSDDTDTMSVFKNFTIWGGSDAVNLDNYASNYEFIDSVWQGSGTGFRIERKTSSVVFNDVDFHDFGTGYKSFGVNHEVVLIDTDFHDVKNKFSLEDLMKNVSDAGTRKELINYFQSEHGINYSNPMPKIVNSANLTPVSKVTFKADAGADLTLAPGDNSLHITGTITDSVGVRNFNEYVIAKSPSGSGSSKDFEGIRLTLAGSESASQREFTLDQFLELHGTYQKNDGSWVSPVVNWITDRLTGDQHPVVIEVKLKNYGDAKMKAYELTEYPNPGINNPNFEYDFVKNGSGGDGGHTGGGDDGHTGGGDGGNTGGDDGGNTGGGDGGNTGGDDGGNTGGGDGGNTGGGGGGNTGGGDGGNTGGGDGGNTGGGGGGNTGGDGMNHTGGGGADEIAGSTGNDTLEGGGGNDTLRGQLGNDELMGGNGADEIWGASGNDTLKGGDGNDSLKGDIGADSLSGGAGDDVLGGFKGHDILLGEIGRDTLYGGAGNDTLDGGSSADFLSAGGGHDLALGGRGNDKIGGAGGNDTLIGDAGNDTLIGAAGDDRIDGSDGNDKLLLGGGNDVLIFSEGNDTVMDFDVKGNDVIDLSLAQGITNFTDLKANHLSTYRGDAVITDAAGNTLTLDDLGIANLSADDFLF